MLLQPRVLLTACIVLTGCFTASCAPVPKWNAEAEAKPFLAEMTFADQKSIKVHRFEAWDSRSSTLIFTTDKVDFTDTSITRLDFEQSSAGDLVGAIEQISDYRFTKPPAKYSTIRCVLRGNNNPRICVFKDGDQYVCYVVVLKPKPEDRPATPSKK